MRARKSYGCEHMLFLPSKTRNCLSLFLQANNFSAERPKAKSYGNLQCPRQDIPGPKRLHDGSYRRAQAAGKIGAIKGGHITYDSHRMI